MRLTRWIALPCLVIFLAACQDSEQQAEDFFRSGMELRESGDLSRATVEFRNVFRYDGAHREARVALAEVLLEQGDPSGAFSQYLRLAEQYPEDADIRIALSEIAVSQQSWDALRRHGPVAVERAPERSESRAIAALLSYIEATEAEDSAAQDAALAQGDALLEADAENSIARRLVIIGRLTKNELEPALAALDDALDRSPDDLALGTLKLQVLNALDRPDEVEALLVDLYDRFPENADIAGDLVTWYRQRDDLPAVEALLRDRAGPLDGPTDDHIALIRFVAQTRGPEAAREEIAALIAANADTPETVDTYVRADAALAFDAGERDAAADMLRARLEDEAETAQTTSIKTMLARILLASGDQVGARALVEEALVAEAGNVDALKMQAEWLIEADKTTEAIAGLRTALDQAPNDADILTLMARAHERAGSPQLAGERLSLAVEMSGSGPAESLRYAQFLLDQDRVRVARTVIDDAVAANPGDVTLLTEQARLALTDDDTAAAEAAIAALERIDGPDAADRATALRAALLLGQQRFDEGIALLEARAIGDETGSAALDVVRTRLRAGQVEEAREYLRLQLEERPDDPTLRFANAVLQMVNGETDTAEAELRDLIEEYPEAEAPAQQLHGLLLSQGRMEEAEDVLAAALAAMPEAWSLRLLQAAQFEGAGDLESALAIYRQLYELDGDNLIAANNYASLLSELHDDPESLDRAYAAARRLGESEVPDFQDTYGWIAYRRGDFEEALTYLEPAAAGRPDSPVILYHLGMAYVALERIEEARTILTRAIELGEGRTIPQLDLAREALAAL